MLYINECKKKLHKPHKSFKICIKILVKLCSRSTNLFFFFLNVCTNHGIIYRYILYTQGLSIWNYESRNHVIILMNLLMASLSFMIFFCPIAATMGACYVFLSLLVLLVDCLYDKKKII